MVCGDTLSLLLPINVQGSTGSTNMSVYFLENVKKGTKRQSRSWGSRSTRGSRGSRGTTVEDVLNCIYDFYNHKTIIPEDLSYVSLTSPETASKILQSYHENPGIIRHLRFAEFIRGHARFAGIKHQNDNIYSIRLV